MPSFSPSLFGLGFSLLCWSLAATVSPVLVNVLPIHISESLKEIGEYDFRTN